MDNHERALIGELFGKLDQAERQSGPRDAGAEQAIREAVQRQPAAPYYMAQTILVQEQALQNLGQRVQELEQQAAQRPSGGGGFLGGLFGTGGPPGRAAGTSPFANRGTAPAAGQARGGFMGSALQTAAAVAGGVLLANAVTGLFSNGIADAQAGEPDVGSTGEDMGTDDSPFDGFELDDF
ncbi:DUF2076 domain-containing protein [Thioalkalicoccus limnaeus]|uniref:DUF2076 domain-containing protein n=1 Tax=Thioalkalicoccus limnaeus TaxID=120681 RepID=A0ABV4BB59_9GAMM